MLVHRLFLFFSLTFFVAHFAWGKACDVALYDVIPNAEEVIQQWQIPRASLASNFVHLVSSGQLIHQCDSELDKNGLLVPKGGLCTSTCVAAISLLIENSNRPHVEQIEKAVQEISVIAKHDARLGAHTLDGAKYLKSLVEKHDLHDRFYFKTRHDAEKEKDFLFQPGEILLTGVRRYHDDSNGGHVIILLAVDPQQKRILAYDPNYLGLIELKYKEEKSTRFLVLYRGTKKWTYLLENIVIGRR